MILRPALAGAALVTVGAWHFSGVLPGGFGGGTNRSQGQDASAQKVLSWRSCI